LFLFDCYITINNFKIFLATIVRWLDFPEKAIEELFVLLPNFRINTVTHAYSFNIAMYYSGVL